MTLLAKGKMDDFKIPAIELGEEESTDLKIEELKKLIVNSKQYEEAFVKELFTTVLEKRKAIEVQQQLEANRDSKEKEHDAAKAANEQERQFSQQHLEADRATKEKEDERQFYLEQLKLQLEAQKHSAHPNSLFPIQLRKRRNF